MKPDTKIFLPASGRVGGRAVVVTVRELFDSEAFVVDKFGRLDDEMVARGDLPPIPEDSDNVRLAEDYMPYLTVGDVRMITDDPVGACCGVRLLVCATRPEGHK